MSACWGRQYWERGKVPSIKIISQIFLFFCVSFSSFYFWKTDIYSTLCRLACISAGLLFLTTKYYSYSIFLLNIWFKKRVDSLLCSLAIKADAKSGILSCIVLIFIIFLIEKKLMKSWKFLEEKKVIKKKICQRIFNQKRLK